GDRARHRSRTGASAVGGAGLRVVRPSDRGPRRTGRGCARLVRVGALRLLGADAPEGGPERGAWAAALGDGAAGRPGEGVRSTPAVRRGGVLARAAGGSGRGRRRHLPGRRAVPGRGIGRAATTARHEVVRRPRLVDHAAARPSRDPLLGPPWGRGGGRRAAPWEP